MITFLSKLLIKDYKNTSSPAVRKSYGMLCGTLGIILSLLLFAGKIFAGILSGSIAIVADALNNLSDAGSSVITLIGFYMAGQKPDSDHPFGHGRIEYLSGLFVSIAILFMAVELIRSSVLKIIHPEVIKYSPVIVWILVFSVLIKVYMVFYNKKIGKKIKSTAICAAATDSMSDILATCVVLLSTLSAHFFNLKIDGICGICVGLFILFAGIRAARDTISPLLGQPPDPELVEKIQNLVLRHQGIIGIHDLIVHNYGPGRLMISLHAEIPADSDIISMHDLIDNIERDLRNELQCEAVIHMDPVCINDRETINAKNAVGKIIHEIDSELTFHDFRIVKGPTHTNIIFDLVIPYKFKYSDEETTLLIEKKVKELNSNYFTVIDVDHAYSI